MNGIPFLDFFAGFGGASSGLVEAGFELSTAYNHWDTAIAVHSANHRRADHVQGDLSGYDMRRLPRGVPFLWASPECTWHSPAGGRKRLRRDPQLDLFDDYVPNEAGERSRATMFDPIRATEARSFDVTIIENVPEVASWPLFPAWLRMWEDLGYSWQIVNASAAHIYSPTNAPAGQWRDRIYIVLNRKGLRMPRIEPRPPAWCEQCGSVVEAVQSWKKDHPIRVGKYGRQYVYVCGAGQHARQVVEPFVLPASAVIDWSDLGERIGDRKRPLAAATMRRIEVGARMFARPAIVAHHGETWDAANPRHPRHAELGAYYRVWAPDAAPLMARNASGGDALAVPPFLTAVNHDADHRAMRLDGGPLPTRSTKIGDGLVFPPFITHHYGDAAGRNGDRRVSLAELPLGAMTTTMSQGIAVPPYVVEYFGTSTARDMDQPLSAVLAGAQHHGLAIPPGAFLSKHHGGLDYRAIEHMNKPISEPLPTIVAAPNVSLVIPTRTRPEASYEGDLPFDLDDVRFRMLGPREHLRAQRFADDYDTSAANKSQTTKGAGNAVPVNVAHWLGGFVAEAIGAAA
ncbi:DNA cytosine methyltransferase [Microbacterium sp. SORGH_AS_0862]|uniref:DNA cytosine methyltransferase n=1 Tax=Microbacterium sp. SORGH_AS_0862 TaxID=3041789 RepID=UPI00278F5B47|nr:DNA cytosine methyltransferase [Microbacterium sp. SORGH_AS_0862]MDQ1206184.1 DNA (cytosine-5)-methyltransferase 1 [Microbacterium sp. SORGH_AS_0862]